MISQAWDAGVAKDWPKTLRSKNSLSSISPNNPIRRFRLTKFASSVFKLRSTISVKLDTHSDDVARA